MTHPAENDALTMEQIEALVEEVIEASAVWPDPLPSRVSAVMDIVREAMAQAWGEGNKAVPAPAADVWEAGYEAGLKDGSSVFDYDRTPNPHRVVPPAVVGCCDSCGGKGGTMSGPCWDCRGTGCAHLDPCAIPPEETR